MKHSPVLRHLNFLYQGFKVAPTVGRFLNFSGIPIKKTRKRLLGWVKSVGKNTLMNMNQHIDLSVTVMHTAYATFLVNFYEN